MLAPDHTPSIGGISGQESDVLAVAVITNLRCASRYVHTCYASLVQSASVQAHAEMYFQVQPHSASSQSVTSSSTISQRGQYAKVWLHPDDVDLGYPGQAHSANQDPVQRLGVPQKRQFRTGARVPTLAAAISDDAMEPAVPTLVRCVKLCSSLGAMGPWFLR